MKNLVLGIFLSLLLILPSQVSLAQVPPTADQVTIAQEDQSEIQTVKPAKNKIFGFLKDINALNIALISFGIFGGGLWFRSRQKLRLIGELFLKIYDYTDDKKLSEEERIDVLNRFLEIIGRSKTKI